jgi:hypothetical protein
MESSLSPPDLEHPRLRDEEIQEMLASAVEAYAGRLQEGADLQPFPAGSETSATDVAMAVAAMLKASEIYSFEVAAMFNV